MRAAALAVLGFLLAGAAPARAAEPTPEQRAFVEVDAGKETFRVGEAVALRVRVGVDAAWFRDHVAPLREDVDVPVHVVLRVAEAPGTPREGGIVFAREPVAGRARRFALNDAAVEGRVLPSRRVGERDFEVVEARLHGVAGRAGPLAIEAPTLEFTSGDVVESSLGFRVVERPTRVVVRGAPVSLRVEPLPAAGRPEGASDAVGRFAIRAEASRRDVEVGRPFTLTVVVSGDARPASGLAGRRFEGFHVLGAVVEASPSAETTRFELSPTRADVTAVPPIAFSFFDPAPDGGWRTVRTEPIPLRVTAAVPAAPGVGRDGNEWRSVDDVVKPPHPLRVALLATAGAALAAAAIVAVRARRARGRRAGTGAGPGAAMRVAGPEAAAEFRRRIARGEGVADAFASALAGVAGCPPAGVVGPDVAERLRAAGASPAAAARAAATMERLVATRYGGGGPEVDAATAAAVLEDLALTGAASPRA